MSRVISPVRLARGQRAYPFIFRRRLLRRSGVVRQVVFSRTIFFNMSPLYSMMTTEPIYSTAEGCGGSFKKEIYGEVGCCESCTDGSNLLSLPLSICISLYLYLCQNVCQGPQKQKLRAENRKSQRTDPGDVNARAQLCMDFCAPFILPSMRAIFLFIRDSMVFGDLGMT